MIGFKHHLAKYGDIFADWDPTISSYAQQILATITSFERLSHNLPVHVTHCRHHCQAPEKALDIIGAHEMITEVFRVYQLKRQNIDSAFAQIYAQSVRIAERVGTTIKMLRITSRQQDRSNAETSSPL